MKFKLLPYSESKHLEGSEDAPIFRNGETRIDEHTQEDEFIWYHKNGMHLHCHIDTVTQLCIEEDCKACEGYKNKMSWSPSSCSECWGKMKTYKLYTGSRCEICDGDGKWEDYNKRGLMVQITCQPCNGTGKVDNTQQIVEALRDAEPSKEWHRHRGVKLIKQREAQQYLTKEYSKL